ncbi:MAG: M50 family metallopeptidase [Candidatus Nealsonbacteria bacterium]|nr:M50 family metallopeptidase [Candidatus Nealsonbacteria bacterium]
MIFTLLIAFFSLIFLVVVHELGHFILAKKFGAEVEEFGIGYPPRFLGKRIGKTLYSLNILPFGAFVKIRGEEGGVEDYRSFAGKPMWQRMSIVLGGVVSFWLIAAVLLSIVAGGWGLPTAVSDEENENLKDPRIQITQIIPDSPAQEADFRAGDIIIGFEKIGDISNFISENKGKEIVLKIKRGQDVFEKKVTPRMTYSQDDGPVGFIITRIALRPYSWAEAPFQGISATFTLTGNIIKGWVLGVKSLLGISQLPEGVKMEMMGPVGILDLLGQYSKMGLNSFLFLVALIAIALALANSLPIPALDGGKILFLMIEVIRKKSVNQKIEQRLTAGFFILLILFVIFVTIKFDIPRIF